MAMIDSDDLKPALKAVFEAQRIWEAAVTARDESAHTMIGRSRRQAAVSTAENEFHKATGQLTYRVQALIALAEAQG